MMRFPATIERAPISTPIHEKYPLRGDKGDSSSKYFPHPAKQWCQLVSVSPTFDVTTVSGLDRLAGAFSMGVLKGIYRKTTCAVKQVTNTGQLCTHGHIAKFIDTSLHHAA